MDLEGDFFASVCLAVEAVAAGQFILEKYPRRRGLARGGNFQWLWRRVPN